MPKVGDKRPDPLLRPAQPNEIDALLRDGIGCRVPQGRRR